MFTSPGALTDRHEVSGFECRSSALTTWLRQYARIAQSTGTNRVYVSCPSGSDVVAGYYALAAGQIEHEDAGPRLRKGVGRHPIPVVVLTRLAVDRSHEGIGLGKALLLDALRRVEQAADAIGVRALLIHAESDDARAFYLHFAEFEGSPSDPMHLLLLMKDLRRALRT